MHLIALKLRLRIATFVVHFFALPIFLISRIVWTFSRPSIARDVFLGLSLNDTVKTGLFVAIDEEYQALKARKASEEEIQVLILYLHKVVVNAR